LFEKRKYLNLLPYCDYLALLKAGCSTAGLFITGIHCSSVQSVGRAPSRQLSSIFASSSTRGAPVKGGTAARLQPGTRQGPGPQQSRTWGRAEAGLEPN